MTIEALNNCGANDGMTPEATQELLHKGADLIAAAIEAGADPGEAQAAVAAKVDDTMMHLEIKRYNERGLDSSSRFIGIAGRFCLGDERLSPQDEANVTRAAAKVLEATGVMPNEKNLRALLMAKRIRKAEGKS